MDHHTKKVIEVKDVDVRFGDVVAVKGLTFDVRQGERVALLGQTGAGKSTLLNLLIGAQAPTAGAVRVAGLDPVDDWTRMQGKIAIAFQAPRLLPWRSAVANVALGLQVLGVKREERLRRAAEWLRRVNLGDALDRFPAQLSGGMRQRVALARAFGIDPEVLLLDEAFSALDEVTAARLRSDFVEVADAAGTSVVIVTHSIQEAFELGHRVVVLRRPATVAKVYDSSQYDLTDPHVVDQLRREVRGHMADPDRAALA